MYLKIILLCKKDISKKSMIKFEDTSVFNLLTAAFFWCVILQRTWNLNKSSWKPMKVFYFLSTFTHWNHSLWIRRYCLSRYAFSEMHAETYALQCVPWYFSILLHSARIAVKKGCDVFSYLYSSKGHSLNIIIIFY